MDRAADRNTGKTGQAGGESAHAPGALVQTLAALGQQRRYAARALLIQEGDQGDNLFVVVRGQVRAFSSDHKGKEITLGVYGEGEYVGEMALDGGLRSASVEALVPTLCSVVTRAQLRMHIAANPDFAFDMMGRLIRRARLATESARSLALIDVYGRMTRLLDQLAGPAAADGTRTIGERITHQQIASHLACSREMVSRLMRDLENGGFVEKRERRVVLLKGLPARW